MKKNETQAEVGTQLRGMSSLVPAQTDPGPSTGVGIGNGVTLVSYADGARFVRSQRRLEALVGSHGVERVISWNASSLQRATIFQQHASAFAMLHNLSRRVREHRPYCMAFKPLALLITLNEVTDGTWVLWSDSSQWNLPSLNHSVIDAAAALDEQRVDAAWGTQHCEIRGTGAKGKGHPRNSWRPAIKNAHRFALVSPEALNAYLPNPTDQAARRRALAATHVLATNVFVKATATNRAIAAKWLSMATNHPHAFCACNQDQAALSLLVYNERLPRIDYCGPFPSNSTRAPAESSGQFMRSQPQKQLGVLVHALATRSFEVQRATPQRLSSRRLEEEAALGCATPLLRRKEASPRTRAPPPPERRSGTRILFVLSTYISSRFHARSLVLTLFSLQQHHPDSRVIIVDKASPVRVDSTVLPKPTGNGELMRWLETRIRFLRAPRETPTKREYGGYAHGLAFLASSTGVWDKRNFEQFVLMQASVVLSEPVPRVDGEDADGCAVRPFQNVGRVGGVLLRGVWRVRMIEHLIGVGLLPANASHLHPKDAKRRNAAHGGGIRAMSANHNAVAASLDGLNQMLASPGTRLAAGGQSVFDHPKPVLKMQSEFLTGVLITQLAQRHQRGTPRSSWYCPQLAWRAPTRPENNTPDSGFYKLHGSGFQWILPSDVVLSALLQLADANQDGRVSRAELTAAILGHPKEWSTLWHAACLAFPIGADSEAARFVVHGPELPRGQQLAAWMSRLRHAFLNGTRGASEFTSSHSSCGHAYDSWFWAEKALIMLAMPQNTLARKMALTGTLPAPINLERTWDDYRNDMYAEPFEDICRAPMQKDEPFWGAAHPEPSVRPLPKLRRFAERLVDGIFADPVSDGRDGLSFLELKRLFRRDGFLSSVVLPACLKFPTLGATIASKGAWHLRSFTNPRRSIRGYSSREPLPLMLDHARLLTFDFARRLEDTVVPRWVSVAPGQQRMQRWDSANNGRVLQCLVSAGLLYGRAAMACLPCHS